jgi:acetyl-CoA carboxylase biotin carboxyl carrier protein
LALTHQEVLEILRIIDASSTCQELVLETGNLRLVVRKAASGSVLQQSDDPPTPLPVNPPEVPARAPAAPGLAYAARQGAMEVASGAALTAQAPKAQAAGPAPPAGAVPVRAPMIGRFYRSPEPGAPPFVEVGSAVEPDDIVGLIEVMKLFNQIKAGVKGEVVAIWAEDGQMVEFGQELMWIAPVA